MSSVGEVPSLVTVSDNGCIIICSVGWSLVTGTACRVVVVVVGSWDSPSSSLGRTWKWNHAR